MHKFKQDKVRDLSVITGRGELQNSMGGGGGGLDKSSVKFYP